MIYVVCNVESGDLLRISEEPIQASGHPLMVKTLDMTMPDLTKLEWSPGGLRFDARPTTERNISGVQYLRRFSQAERIAIRDAAKQSPELDDYLKLLDITIAQGGVIDLNDADTIAAVGLLEMVGLIATGRAAEVLA